MKPIPEVLSSPPTPYESQWEPWRRWFYDVYRVVGQDGGLSVPTAQIGNATWTTENSFQDLVNVDKGIYVNYSSGVNGIIYGFACNVKRSSGSALVVGAQINAYATQGSTGDVFGLATSAICEAGAIVNIIGYEPDTINLDPGNTKVKWGIYSVFKDRMDGAGAVTSGLSVNQYNLYAAAMVFESQTRSSAGENCGWTVGLDFHNGWCDKQTTPAWSAVVTYIAGMTIISGGLVWKAIQASLNQLPAPGSAFWVQHTPAGTVDNAVGIDFSSMGLASMALMASAIRLRATQFFHWEETGAVGTDFNAVTGQLEVLNNQGVVKFAIAAGTGKVTTALNTNAPGGGAAATLATIGGTGPTVAAQQGWLPITFNGVTAGFIPMWV